MLIAEDGDDAEAWQQRQPSLGAIDVVWVSPRSPGRARGQVCDAVLVTDNARQSLTDEQYTRLLEQAMPSVATRGD